MQDTNLNVTGHACKKKYSQLYLLDCLYWYLGLAMPITIPQGSFEVPATPHGGPGNQNGSHSSLVLLRLLLYARTTRDAPPMVSATTKHATATRDAPPMVGAATKHATATRDAPPMVSAATDGQAPADNVGQLRHSRHDCYQLRKHHNITNKQIAFIISNAIES